MALIFALSFGGKSFACDWMPKSIKISAFVDGKTIFWGRTTEVKWDREAGLKKEEMPTLKPDFYHIVEIIKPLQGKAGKTVKVWSDTSSCGTQFSIGAVRLFVTETHGKRDFYTDQFLSNRARSDSIVAFLEEGLDWAAFGTERDKMLNEIIGKDCFSIESSEKSASPEECKAMEAYQNSRQEIYDREYDAAQTLGAHKPWWKF